MILWLYNHFFTVQRVVAIFHNERQNPPHWIVFHKDAKMKHQIIVSEDEMICLHNKLQNPSHWIVLNEGLWFETDLEDKLGRRGPQCLAGPSPSAYSRSALPACGAESRTSGSEAEPEKQGQKLPFLATTPGWTFVFFRNLKYMKYTRSWNTGMVQCVCNQCSRYSNITCHSVKSHLWSFTTCVVFDIGKH